MVDLPPGKSSIGSKWVYKIKYKANGEVKIFKARLVAKGYNQPEGLDYHETFSPVAKMVTVRSMIALAASKDRGLFQMDVYNAFLQGDLYEKVYMDLPQCFKRQGRQRPVGCCNHCMALNRHQDSGTLNLHKPYPVEASIRVYMTTPYSPRNLE